MADPECSCQKCRSACERMPGLFTPAEALQAVGAGYADRIMAIGYDDERGRYRALAPRTIPPEGIYHPTAVGPHFRLETAAAKGRCTFLKDGLCEIHRSGFKPRECATALLCREIAEAPKSNATVRDLWASRDGLAALSEWEGARC